MTCLAGIVGKNKTYLGADSQASTHSWKINVRCPKVFRVNGRFLVGVCGAPRVAQLVKHGFEPPTQKEGVDDYEYLCTEFIDALRKRLTEGGAKKIIEGGVEETGGDSAFLVAYKNRLYEIESNFQVNESQDNYMAQGSGYAFALGSLRTSAKNPSLTERVRIAIEAASHYDPSVGGPIVIEELEHITKKNDGRKA